MDKIFLLSVSLLREVEGYGGSPTLGVPGFSGVNTMKPAQAHLVS